MLREPVQSGGWRRQIFAEGCAVLRPARNALDKVLPIRTIKSFGISRISSPPPISPKKTLKGLSPTSSYATGQANGNRGGMIGGAARRLRVDTLKPPRLANPVRRRTSRSLAPDCLRLRSRRGTRGANPVRSVLALNKALHQSPRSRSSNIIADSSSQRCAGRPARSRRCKSSTMKE